MGHGSDMFTTSKNGATEEYLANPVRTIAQGITSSGAIVGTTAVDGDRAAFLLNRDGSLKTFLVNEPDAVPGLSNATTLVVSFSESDDLEYDDEGNTVEVTGDIEYTFAKQ